MKRISLLAVLIAGVLASGLLAAEGPNTLDLDGREVVVRVYMKRLPEQRVRAEQKTVIIRGRTFRLEVEDADDSTRLEIVGWEQKDELVRQFLGRRSYSYKYREGPVFHLPVNSDEFEGRPVTVRIYENCIIDPAAYKKQTFQATKGVVKIDPADVTSSAFVVIFGRDQDDGLISRVLGSRAYGWTYRQGMEYTLPLKVVLHKQQDYRWTFLDALGEPVTDAVVQVYVEQDEKVAWVGSSKTDSDGTAVFDFCPATGKIEVRIGEHTHGYSTSNIRFVVKHPYYGRSVIETHRSDRKPPHLLVPAVDAGSEADQRAFWGQVVDNENKPLAGLFVKAGSFRPLGGEWIGHVSGQSCGALTDENGRFRIYLPPSEDSLKIGWLIPPKSECRIWIKPPIQLGLMHFSGVIPNGRENTITLERPERYAHTFAFANDDGPITDRAMLRRICINIERAEKTDVRLRYDDWRTGGMFPTGIYQARYSSGGGDFVFEPIEVTADSPEELVFRVPTTKKVYYGRVVDGVTGRPIEGAFVIDMDSSGSGTNLSTVTGEQWEALHELPNEVSRRDKTHSKALRPLCYGSTRLVRTDSDGWFEMSMPKERSFGKVVIFEQDYLTVITAKSKCRAEEDDRFAVPLTRLFPAAKVTVETWAENPRNSRHPALWSECVFDKTNNPGWINDLLAAWEVEGATFMDDIRNDFIVHLNEKETFPIPAGLNMQLQLRPRYSHRDKGWAPMIIAENINLAQGETLDLGRHQILRNITVFVLVLNSPEQPIEGVPVNADDQYGRQTSNTGEDGAAIFELAPDSKGEFVVEYKPAEGTDDPHLREAMPFEITGIADANSVFTLKVSDELLYHLFK
jgi:hypothetical protein